MQDMNIYIVIGDPNDARRSATIKGDFEILRAFLSGVGSFEMQSAPTFPAVDPSPIMPTHNKRKKSAKETLSILTA